jgi:hypothetical protein
VRTEGPFLWRDHKSYNSLKLRAWEISMTDAAAGFFNLSILVQVALGSGYLAYVTAYAGYRRDHNISDQLFITLVFSSIALFTAKLLVGQSDYLVLLGMVAASLACSVLWRALGLPSWQWILEELGVHREDGVHSGWASLVQTKMGVSQITVYLNDGRTLHLQDRDPYRELPWKGIYLCGDGSITMIVDSETLPNGTEIERVDISDEDWGARFSHIPASQISRVELRLK